MGFGAPWNFADATFSLKTTGDGQGIRYVYRPIAQQSFVAWSPPGALTTQSVLYHNLQPNSSGTHAMMTAATLSSLTPWNASYLVIVPPVTSSIAKTMLGNNSDVGIALIPWLPNVIALPNPVPVGWQVLYNFASAEDTDIFLF